MRGTGTLSAIAVDFAQLLFVLISDKDRPLFHVIAEAGTDAEARQLVDKYSGLVQGLQ